MVIPAGTRQRVWKPKNRTGCKTCKIRKVKCDEEKPYCKRCTSTGRTCDGYDDTYTSPRSSQSPPTRANDQYDQCSFLPTAGSEVVRVESPVYLVPALRLETAEERDSFDFFTSHAVPSLRGFIDSSFWQCEVFQAAQQHPAIQNCIIALGAMHRRFYESDGSQITQIASFDKQLQFALRQSNAAIRNLVGGNGSKSTTDKLTLMTCSILFSSMACLQGQTKAAYDHLRSGIQMLNELDAQEEPETTASHHPIIIDSLRALFISLDLQARSIRPSADAASWVARPKSCSVDILPNAELNMASLLELLRYQEALLNHIHAFYQHIVFQPAENAPTILPEYHALLRRSHTSFTALNGLSAQQLAETGSNKGTDFTNALNTLHLQHSQISYLLRFPRADINSKFGMTLSLNTITDPYPTPFNPTTHFEHMFDLAVSLLPPLSTPGTQSHAKPVYTTATGPLSALWLVAMRAPSSCVRLRRRAVEIMLGQRRREGFWDGRAAGRIVERLMEVEVEREAGLVGRREEGREVEVSDESRIIAVIVRYGDQEGDGVEGEKPMVEYLSGRDVREGKGVPHLEYVVS
ncbi:hypothetical protein T440DRAFT_441397 [Plenodomus tracheiphilus IPT5]|uniref:Zn(2)-C6 fungal-type domain-containing protein n=1 Tax=Plenodomus tracheiphilus IPT5 TaxID=1408161 RepID=A0A6A7BJA6_9PLEO|nr:hypothetical protein T440DRAFT_441397 [Plenodomus tracheiphilus IPT5]